MKVVALLLIFGVEYYLIFEEKEEILLCLHSNHAADCLGRNDILNRLDF